MSAHIRGKVLALISEHQPPPSSDAEPLLLDSFAVVALLEALEDAFDIRVRSTEAVPENLATLGRLVAFVERKRGEA